MSIHQIPAGHPPGPHGFVQLCSVTGSTSPVCDLTGTDMDDSDYESRSQSSPWPTIDLTTGTMASTGGFVEGRGNKRTKYHATVRTCYEAMFFGWNLTYLTTLDGLYPLRHTFYQMVIKFLGAFKSGSQVWNLLPRGETVGVPPAKWVEKLAALLRDEGYQTCPKNAKKWMKKAVSKMKAGGLVWRRLTGRWNTMVTVLRNGRDWSGLEVGGVLMEHESVHLFLVNYYESIKTTDI